MTEKLSEIRMALAAWYDGSADESQERILREFFSVTDPDSLPAGMRSDAMLFRGMALLGKETAPELKVGNRRRIWRTILYPAVAVCFAFVAVLSLKRPVYGYDFDGNRITSQSEAMESAEYLDCLALLDEDVSMISEMIK